MLFCLTVLDKETQVRKFSLSPNEIETGLDFVTELVAKGERLLNVWLQEGTKKTELPLHIFDGMPCRAAMQEIQQVGQALLRNPSRSKSRHHQDLIDLTRKRLQLYESHIASQQVLIDRLKVLQGRADWQIQGVSTRSKLIRRYQFQIDTYRRQINLSQRYQQQLRQRLTELGLG